MIVLLLSATLSCSEGQWILQGIEKTELTRSEKTDLKMEIWSAMPDDCKKEQYEL